MSDLFTCDVGKLACTPAQTPAVQITSSGNGWTDLTTTFGDGYTTTNIGDFVGVPFTGVEGYYTGLVGPWAGAYGCSFDGGETYTNYSAYQYDHATEKLCAWKSLPATQWDFFSLADVLPKLK